MNLTYNKTSGAIKRDGAVVGRIDPAPGGFEATLYASKTKLHDRDISELLKAVRTHLEKTVARRSQ